jgi:DUF2917 family protein
MEVVMITRPNFVRIALKARSVYRIANGLGLKVSCLRGQVWVTQSNDPRDIIVTGGNSFVLDRPGVAVVFAFTDALTLVGEPELVAGANENTPAGAGRSAA